MILVFLSWLGNKIYWELKSSEFAASKLIALIQCGEIGHSWRQALLTTFLFSLFFPRRLQIIRKLMPLSMSPWALMLSRHSCRYQFNGCITGAMHGRIFCFKKKQDNSLGNPHVCPGLTSSKTKQCPRESGWHRFSHLMFNLLRHLYSVFCCLVSYSVFTYLKFDFRWHQHMKSNPLASFRV